MGPVFSELVLFTCVIHYLTLHQEPSLQGEWLAVPLAWIISSDSGLQQKSHNNPLLSFQKKKKKWGGGGRGEEAYTKNQQNPQPPHANFNKCPGMKWWQAAVRGLQVEHSIPFLGFSGLLLWCQSNSCSSCSCILPLSAGTCCDQGSENPQRCNFLLITLAWLWQAAIQHNIGGDVDPIHN